MFGSELLKKKKKKAANSIWNPVYRIKFDPPEALLQLSRLEPFYNQPFQSICSAEKGVMKSTPSRPSGCWICAWHWSCSWRSNTLQAFRCEFWCQPLTGVSSHPFPSTSNHSHLSIIWCWSMTPSRFQFTAWHAYNHIMLLLPWSLYFYQINWLWGDCH